jgi:hypothetical protein
MTRFIAIGFVVVPSAYLIWAFVLPMLEIQTAKSWTPTPCTIVSSGLKTHGRFWDETTFSIDVKYRYSVNGKDYESDRFELTINASAYQAWQMEVARRYLPGTQATCYVNPANPQEAVIDRSWTKSVDTAILAGAFMFFGVIGVLVTSAKRTGTSAKKAVAEPAGPVRLHVTPPRGCEMATWWFFALFGNGFLLLMQWMAWYHDEPPGPGSKILLAVFQLIGLCLLWSAYRSTMEYFNPRVHITIDRPRVRMGEMMTVTWEVPSGHRRIQSLRLILEGREEWQSGTGGEDTHTEKAVFATIPIAEVSQSEQIKSGAATVLVPASCWYTYIGRHSERDVVWAIKVLGIMRKGPPIDEEFGLKLFPGLGTGELQ